MSYKNCGNCGRSNWCDDYLICVSNGRWCWKKIECPSCGGALSEIRYHNGKPYRHCYSCHFDHYGKEG